MKPKADAVGFQLDSELVLNTILMQFAAAVNAFQLVPTQQRPLNPPSTL